MTAVPETCGPTQTPTDVDIPALREKYKHERAKRLRKEGSKQYVETSDGYADFAEIDPHTPVSSATRSSRTSTSPCSAAGSADC